MKPENRRLFGGVAALLLITGPINGWLSHDWLIGGGFVALGALFLLIALLKREPSA